MFYACFLSGPRETQGWQTVTSVSLPKIMLGLWAPTVPQPSTSHATPYPKPPQPRGLPFPSPSFSLPCTPVTSAVSSFRHSLGSLCLGATLGLSWSSIFLFPFLLFPPTRLMAGFSLDSFHVPLALLSPVCIIKTSSTIPRSGHFTPFITQKK